MEIRRKYEQSKGISCDWTADWQTAAKEVAKEFIPIFNDITYSDLQGCVCAAISKFNLGEADRWDAENLALELINQAQAHL